MQQLSATSHAALRHLLEAQPATQAKVAFAWRMAAGPALDRATAVDWREGVLRIRANGDAWRKEVRAMRGALLRRMQELLGTDVVARIEID